MSNPPFSNTRFYTPFSFILYTPRCSYYRLPFGAGGAGGGCSSADHRWRRGARWSLQTTSRRSLRCSSRLLGNRHLPRYWSAPARVRCLVGSLAGGLAVPPGGLAVPPGGLAVPPEGGLAVPPAGGLAVLPAGGLAVPPAGGYWVAPSRARLSHSPAVAASAASGIFRPYPGGPRGFSVRPPCRGRPPFFYANTCRPSRR